MWLSREISPTSRARTDSWWSTSPIPRVHGSWGRAEALHDTESVAVPEPFAQVAYVADDHCGLQIVDVSAPAAPRLLGSADTPDAALGVAVSGEHVYVVDYTAGLMILPAQCSQSTGIEDGVPDASRMLLSVWPNPSSSATFIQFATAGEGRVRIGVYDPQGRRIRDLSEDDLRTGTHRLVWDGRDDGGRAVPAGWYLIGVKTGRATATTRLVMIH